MDYEGLLEEVTEELAERDEYSGLFRLNKTEQVMIDAYSKQYMTMRARGAEISDVYELKKIMAEALEGML